MTDNSFVWNDATVKEMIYSKLPIPEHYCGNLQKCLDEFKQSKLAPPPVKEQCQATQVKYFTEAQYLEIWNMIFSQTGYPENHPMLKKEKTDTVVEDKPQGKVTVVGISTGSHDVETWHFNKGESSFMDSFCKQLSESTGMTVVVVNGEVSGTYESKFVAEYKEGLSGKMDNIREACKRDNQQEPLSENQPTAADTGKEQEPCSYCGKTLREQMKGCTEMSCYRQYLEKLPPKEHQPKAHVTWAVQKGTFDILDTIHELDKPDQWWTFPTKDDAEKFVKENKPQEQFNTVTDNSDVACLSLNDCSKWYEAWYPNNPMKEAFLFGLSQIVKQKLKQ